MARLDQIKEGHFTHPLIGHIYLKKDFGAHMTKPDDAPDDVLVIETQFPVGMRDGQDFSTCLAALLDDLPELQRQAEAKIGRFDRVDIRYVH